MLKGTTRWAAGLVGLVAAVAATSSAYAAPAGAAADPVAAGPVISTSVVVVKTANAARLASAAQQDNVTVTVAAGNTLSGLVTANCGPIDWRPSWDANRDRLGDNPHLIHIGWTLTLVCGGSATVTTQEEAPPAPVAAPPAPVAVSAEWVDPLPNHTPYCNFWQWRGSYNHEGEDIPAPAWTPIRAAHAGTVSTGWDNGAGNYTVISHDGMAEVYMHQVAFERTSGWINVGEILGYVGSTGDSTGPHLHFEVHPWGAWNGVTNPTRFLAERGAYMGC